MRTLCCLLLAISATCALPPAQADVLSLESNAASTLPRPTRGMTMDQVERQYGPPLEKHPAVGKPPITRWDYDQFSVFFEYRIVLHSVVQHKIK